jgi:hypothetical protein
MPTKPITKKEMAARAKKIKDLAKGEVRPIEGVLVCACPCTACRKVGKITVHVNLIADVAKCHLCGVEMSVKTLIRKWEEGDDD